MVNHSFKNDDKVSTKEKVVKVMYVLCGVILFNVLSIYSCTMLGCYEVSFANVFRMNLLCNVCTDMSYNLYKHQMEIYFTIGGVLVKVISDVITGVMSGVTPKFDN